MESIIINLFAGPSAGKSSISSGLTYMFKKSHITCDNPYEFTKLLAWNKNKEAVKDQLYIVANQHRNITQSFGKVKYIILDSPILLSLVYKDLYENSEYPSKLYDSVFDELVINLHNSYNSINIFLNRSENGVHNDGERFQTHHESLLLDNRIKETLNKNNVPYHQVNVDDDTLDNIIKIVNDVQQRSY